MPSGRSDNQRSIPWKFSYCSMSLAIASPGRLDPLQTYPRVFLTCHKKKTTNLLPRRRNVCAIQASSAASRTESVRLSKTTEVRHREDLRGLEGATGNLFYQAFWERRVLPHLLARIIAYINLACNVVFLQSRKSRPGFEPCFIHNWRQSSSSC